VLHLRFAALAGSPDATTAIGRRIVEALRAQGLAATWDGDAAHTIELSVFDWKRRSPPVEGQATWTAGAVLDRWRRELSRMAYGNVAYALEDAYAAATVPAGAVDVAIARASALPDVALAVRGCDVPATRITDLWLEAYAAAPGGRTGALIELLVVGGELVDGAVRAAARERMLRTRDDMHGAAVAAWYLMRAPNETAAGLHDDDRRAPP
jgi:hypothetical protein